MGFWKAIQRIATGQPVFQVTDDGAPQDASKVTQTPTSDASFSNNQPTDDPTPYDVSGHKILPHVTFEDCSVKLHGEDCMDVWATIHNDSDIDVELNKCDMLGHRREVGDYISAHGSKTILIYSGDIPTHNNYKKAELYFTTKPFGDYFLAEHEIRYEFEHGQYVIEDLRLIPPIRDI